MDKIILETVKNGIFVPKGIISKFDLVYDESNNLVEFSEYRSGENLSRDRSKAPKKLPSNLKVIKSEIKSPVVFLGHFEVWHYGHWLIEGLARFWCLLDQDISNYHFPASNTLYAKARYIKKRTMQAKMVHWKNGLKTFGIQPKQFIYYRKPVRIREILVPECSMYSGYRITQEHIKVGNAVAFHICNGYRPQYDSRPVYLSRSKLSKGVRKTQGEMPIEDYCRQQGFRIVYPEHMSFLEQVKMVNENDAFVGFAGSAFHSLILRFTDRPVKCLYMYDHRQHVTINLIDEIMGTTSKYVNCCIKVHPDKRIFEFEFEKAISAIEKWLLS